MLRLRGVAGRLHPAARIWSPPPTAYLRGPSFRAASSTAAAAMAAPAAAKVESPTTRVVGIVLFSSLVGYVTYLCSWQLKRYEWKMALVQLRKERVTGEVRPLTEFVSAADLADVERAEQLAAVVGEEEFRRVAVRGEFDHAQQMLLGPRSAPPGAKQHGAPGGSPSGWDIVTPLRCEDGTVVLVNRGWVPRDSTVPARDPKTGAPNGHAFGVPAAFGQPRGAQEVHGVLKRGEQKNKYARPNPHPNPNPNVARRRREHVRPEHHSLCRHYSLCHTSPCRYAENKPEERRYVWLDLSTMASEGGSAPLLIVAAAQPGEHRKCSSHSECICECSVPRRCGAPRHGKCSHKARHRKCSHKARLRKCSHSDCDCDCDCECSVPRLIVAAAQPRQAAADSRVAAPHLHGIQTGCIPAVRCITLRSYSLTHTRRAAVIIRVAHDEAARVLPRLLRLPYHPLGAPCTRALHTRPAHAPCTRALHTRPRPCSTPTGSSVSPTTALGHVTTTPQRRTPLTPRLRRRSLTRPSQPVRALTCITFARPR
jgi:cytochrome oxidase assembly protein ShyY1